MTLRFAISCAIALSCPATGHAKLPEVSCDDSARLIETLRSHLGAERQGMGLRDPETIVEVWVTERNGDWLIVQNYANGTSCIVAMGEHWQDTLPNPA